MKGIVLLCFLALVVALPPHFRDVSRFNADPKVKGASELWFVQRLDHFDFADQRTWNQRYFVNSTFWKQGGPIFVMIGGEGALAPKYVISYEVAVYAKTYGALILGLEHRFYGKSKPLPDLSTANLKYLSSQQALADLSNFIESMKIKYNAMKSPVVTFGGSYPGALSAWFRMKFPHQTIGSIASSAPVQAELDFLEYLDVVDQSLTYFTGKECDERIQQATDIIQSMLKTPAGTKKIEKMFGLCAPLKGEKDIATFISNVMGNFMGTVQYDNEGNPITIETVCDIMENKTMDALTAYIAVSDLFVSSQNLTCFDCSYDNFMATVINVTQIEEGVGVRQWTYQTCVEFGYFQTTDSLTQPFGNLVPLSYYTDQCKEAFGFNFLPAINATNNYYGGNQPKGATRIVFVNGSIDPWHALGITEDIDDTLTAIYIEGTAHCADMHPAKPSDPPGLAAAQAKISRQIGAWLQSSQ